MAVTFSPPPSKPPGWIDARFGTARGLVRLALSYGETALRLASVRAPDAAEVRRLVFVCHGNICRSAFADVAAAEAGLVTASFGLSASHGAPAHPPVVALARDMGVDLSRHRATEREAYRPQPGDLLLAMEARQLRRIAADERLAHLPRTLLGLYTRPVLPHLHDPYRLNDPYTRACLQRIASAIPELSSRFPKAAR